MNNQQALNIIEKAIRDLEKIKWESTCYIVQEELPDLHDLKSLRNFIKDNTRTGALNDL